MDDKVEVSKSELQQLLDQNKQLMAENSNLVSAVTELQRNPAGTQPVVNRAVTERTVKISMVNGKPIIGFANRGTATRPSYIYDRPDPNNPRNMLLYVDLVIQGVEKPVAVNYNEFLREHEHAQCKVLKTEDKPWVIPQGFVPRQEVQDYRMQQTGEMVQVEIVGKSTVFTVELPDGKPLEIADAYVNII
jgi:hypothetical protein